MTDAALVALVFTAVAAVVAITATVVGHRLGLGERQEADAVLAVIEEALASVAARLKEPGNFDVDEVRVRQAALVELVHELPAVADSVQPSRRSAGAFVVAVVAIAAPAVALVFIFAGTGTGAPADDGTTGTDEGNADDGDDADGVDGGEDRGGDEAEDAGEDDVAEPAADGDEVPEDAPATP
jgi:hypothetical protein